MADDGPAIETGDIEEASFTVNRYVVSDGEVIEEQIDAQIEDDDIAAFEAEVDTAIDDAISEREGGADASPGDTGDTSTVATNVMSTARTVVSAADITKQDWPTFASEMRERGVTDQAAMSEAWSQLRDEGAIGEPESVPPEPESEPEEAGDGEEEAGADVGDVDEAQIQIPAGTDILVVDQGEAASSLVIDELIEPIEAGEVLAVPVSSDEAEVFVEPLPDDVQTPLYIEATEEGLVHRELGDLLGEYV